MLSRIRKNMDEKDQGFTLIELLVVIIIIGILAAIAIPVFLNQREKAHESSMKSDLRTAANEMESAFVDTQDYTAESIELPDETNGNTITVHTSTTSTTFCLDAESDNTDKRFHYSSTGGGIGDGTCAAADDDDDENG